MADIPSGTGLGSSGAFTVGLLRAQYAFKREHITTGALAEEACRIEIDTLRQPVGKQDQYIAAFGGLTCFEFHPDDRVTVSPLAIDSATLHDLQEHLLLFFTGYSRSASTILRDQELRTESGEPEIAESMNFTQELGWKIKTALEAGDTRGFAEHMHEHWQFKRLRSSGMSNSDIDHWYELGRRHGALGGKLVGAGAGGFLLFYAEDPTQLRRALEEEQAPRGALRLRPRRVDRSLPG